MMNYARLPRISEPVDLPEIRFPPPPAEALANAGAANAWYEAAFEAAGEPIYHPMPGMPGRCPHDAMVFALARSAAPTQKRWIAAVLDSATSQLRHIADEERTVPLGAEAVLRKLVTYLNQERCAQGWFHVTACNATLADELNTSPRAIRRHLSRLQEAGFIYRHYTTGEIGLKRYSLDLGPLVHRLDELQADHIERARRRAQRNAVRARSATYVAFDKFKKKTGGEDNIVLLNTDDSKSVLDSVSAQEDAVARSEEGRGEGPGRSTPGRSTVNYGPVGRPQSIPKPEFVAAMCPNAVVYLGNSRPSWPSIIESAYHVGGRWGLNQTAWATLCQHLGREWAAITVLTVAELPASRFTQSNAPTVELRRAAYVGGIVKKLKKGQDISVMASWKRHVKIKQAGSLAATMSGQNY
jgi:DNA-binding transcriptional ArsR family regulator